MRLFPNGNFPSRIYSKFLRTALFLEKLLSHASSEKLRWHKSYFFRDITFSWGTLFSEQSPLHLSHLSSHFFSCFFRETTLTQKLLFQRYYLFLRNSFSRTVTSSQQSFFFTLLQRNYFDTKVTFSEQSFYRAASSWE